MRKYVIAGNWKMNNTPAEAAALIEEMKPLVADAKCEVCGKPHSAEAPLNAHHIMPRQFFSGLRFDVHNGACLCPKCHKMGKFSAHKGGLWFGEWLRNHFPERYAHCLLHKDDEIDCKDRMALYEIEINLHFDETYRTLLEPLSTFRVTLVSKDPSQPTTNVTTVAYNKKAAEFLAFNKATALLQYTPDRVKLPFKGILKTEKVKG